VLDNTITTEEVVLVNLGQPERPKPVLSEKESSKTVGVFEIAPLEKGQGTTLGTSLRRILWQGYPGYGIVGMKIQYTHKGETFHISHPYETLPGMKEDLFDILDRFKAINCIL